MRWPAFSFLATALLLAACVSTRPTPLTGPHMALIVPGFCSGEDCAFHFEAVASTAFDVREGDSTPARVINHIGRRDTVFVENGNLRVTAPGVVVIKRDLVLTANSADSTTAVARSYPVVEQWLFVRPRTGLAGWVKERNNNIGRSILSTKSVRNKLD